MTLSEELTWRGFLERTTYKDITAIDSGGLIFYWGVEPSSDSMTVGNLAAAIMAKHFINGGHKAVLLVGGATGLIGDPDGKAKERDLISVDEVNRNKHAIAEQYRIIFEGQDFELVDNYDWFKDINYLQFLREIGKHVPMRQMLSREFVQSRLSEDGEGISYAEFSYSLIQGYDFLKLHKDKGVTLQIAGSDQWGNSIAGVELIRRITGDNVNIWTSPLIIDKNTGKKFGKSEDGAVWLDPAKTSPTAFYQFWINTPDNSVKDYLKIYTFLTKDAIEKLIQEQSSDPSKRSAQKVLAYEVTKLIHGKSTADLAKSITSYLTLENDIADANEEELSEIRKEIPALKINADRDLTKILVSSGLTKSNTEARSLISDGAIYVNGQTYKENLLDDNQFNNNRLLLRRGKAFKDSALIEL